MELWFWAALGGAVFAGLSNFYFKQAAARGYNAELFSLYGSLLSLILVGVLFIIKTENIFASGYLVLIPFIGGCLAALTNILKIHALRHIDSTIYFPLFKLFAPAIAIVAGVTFFQESFSTTEWVGMALGLFVPLLLITRAESGRQSNLIAGLILILLTSMTSASSAIFNKYASDVSMPISVILLYASLGILIGSAVTILHKIGWNGVKENIYQHTSFALLKGAGMRASLIFCSFWLMLYAFANGGPLAVVQTINSMYILIPIVLSIIFYKEHWNTQKVAAIILSIAALALLG